MGVFYVHLSQTFCSAGYGWVKRSSGEKIVQKSPLNCFFYYVSCLKNHFEIKPSEEKCWDAVFSNNWVVQSWIISCKRLKTFKIIAWLSINSLVMKLYFYFCLLLEINLRLFLDINLSANISFLCLYSCSRFIISPTAQQHPTLHYYYIRLSAICSSQLHRRRRRHRRFRHCTFRFYLERR